jgi:hypothetical protein
MKEKKQSSHGYRIVHPKRHFPLHHAQDHFLAKTSLPSVVEPLLARHQTRRRCARIEVSQLYGYDTAKKVSDMIDVSRLCRTQWHDVWF